MRPRLELLEQRQMLAADLVSDIDSAPAGSSIPTAGVVSNDLAYFANTDAAGTELWKSDGTAAGTTRIKDINVGGDSSNPYAIEPLGSGVVFKAYDGTQTGLWYSDGTAAGTIELYSNVGGGEQANVDGEIFFNTYDYNTGDNELWKTDGTVIGTVPVKDFGANSQFAYFTAVGDQLFFAHDNSAGNELWVSDGTSIGTVMVEDITMAGAYGSIDSNPRDLIEANGKLFFTAEEDNSGAAVPSGSGRELWVSDGTAAGTFLLNDINPGSYPFTYPDFYDGSVDDQTVSGGLLYFTAIDDSGDGRNLWVSDGTVAGTEKLTTGNTFPTELTDVDGTLVFVGTDNSGTELWRSNGTTAGTLRFKTIQPGVGGSYPSQLFESNDEVYFIADDGVSGRDLWKSDATTGGTTKVFDFASSSYSNPSFVEAAGKLFFEVPDAGFLYDLWVTDGTSSGTMLVEDLNNDFYGYLSPTFGLSSQLIFLDGNDLFATDGTPNSAQQLTDNVLTAGANPTLHGQTDDQVFVKVDNDLWASDGTAPGTEKVNPAGTSIGVFFDGDSAAIGGVLFYSGYDLTDSYELWRTDGTEAGTFLVKDIRPGGLGSYPQQFETVGSEVFFVANSGPGFGYELWKSDGTAAGTVIVKNINPGSASSEINHTTNVNGTLYFSANDGTNGTELWSSDGTAAGTNMVEDLTPGPGSSYLLGLTAFDGMLAFHIDGTAYIADTTSTTALTLPSDYVSGEFEQVGSELFFAVNSDEIWKTDGTPSGTMMVADLSSSPYSYSYPSSLTAVGSDLFFVAEADPNVAFDNRELWKFDGTSASIVKDINPGTTSSYPSSLTSFQDHLLFFADDGSTGNELWISDGTTAGTTLINNIHEADPSSSVYTNEPTRVVDDQLFFVADNGTKGRELWRFTLPLLSADAPAVVAPEGSLATLTGTFRFADSVTADIGNVAFDTATGLWTWSETTPNGPLTQTVTLTATDSAGLTEQLQFSFESTNVAPIVSIAPGAVTDDAQEFTLMVGIVDPGNDVVSVDIDWGDGTTQTLAPATSYTHTYADGDSTPTVTVTATDDTETGPAATQTVTVNDVPATIALTGASNVAEGAPFTLNFGAVTDPGDDTPISFVVDWGDGTSETVPASTTSLLHTYADGDSSPVIVVDVIDEETTHVSAGSLTITVDDVAPELSISGDATVAEGSPYSLTLSSVIDPGDDLVADYIVHWGDGNSDTYSTSGTVTHVYTDGSSTPTITVDLVDEEGTYTAVDSLSVTVLDVAPQISISGDASVDEGSTYSLTLGTVTDPGDDTVSSIIVDWGDGNSDTYTTGGVVTHIYADGNSTPTISVDLVDEEGTYTDVATQAVNVQDIAPTLSISGDASVDEGATYSLTLGAVTDPGDDVVSSFVVDWGDGNSDTYATGGVVTHTYADGDSNPTISVDLIDEEGSYLGVDTLSVAVLDVAPTITLSGDAAVSEGDTYTLNFGSVNDPGTDSPTNFTVHWGDGNSETVPSTTTSLTHIYADGDAAVTIVVDITDEDATHLAAGELAIQINDVAPSMTISGNATVDEGTPYTLTLGTVADPGDDLVSSYIVNWGDGQSDTFNSDGPVVHQYADGDANVVITVDLVDEEGTYLSVDTLNLTVNDVAPTTTLSGPNEISQFDVYTLTLGAANDLGDDTVTQWIVDWGDGTTDTYFAPGDVDHVYTIDGGTPVISVDLVDEEGTYLDVASLAITVIDEPVYFVTNTGDSGPGSLRDAIAGANAEIDPAVIFFDIPGPGPHEIVLSTALPVITTTVFIDGESEPDFVDQPVIGINGSNVAAGDGLRIESEFSLVSGLAVYSFPGDGIEIRGQQGNTLLNNYIGIDLAGTAAGNLFGLRLQNSDLNLIESNVVSGNDGTGVIVNGTSSNNLLLNNFVGTDASGTAALPNAGNGILVRGPANIIGGAGEGNLISGNIGAGISISADALGTTVQGNRIGTDASGQIAIPNTSFGLLAKSGGNIIGGPVGGPTGGPVTGDGNLISGNGIHGIIVSGASADDNEIQGNWIGVDSLGTSALPNGSYGVYIAGAENTLIGGTDPDEANVISGNVRSGVSIANSTATQLIGNLIGTNVDGTDEIGNGAIGVYVIAGSNNNLISENQIAGNDSSGIAVIGPTSTNNVISKNLIGVKANGIELLNNGVFAVLIGSSGNTIGGAAGDGNTIAGSTRGLVLSGPSATGNIVSHNSIGIDTGGTVDLGMSTGIQFAKNAANNTIGPDNTIAFNTTGVRLLGSSGSQNEITQNSFTNNGIGIDLSGPGITNNDVGDDDEGANRTQNHPEFLNAEILGADLEIEFQVPTLAANATYPLMVELFLADAFGQGQTYLGSVSYSAADSAIGVVPKTLAGAGIGLANGDFISATATDQDGNTSEFSAAISVGAPPAAALQMNSRSALDVSADGILSPLDILLVLNDLSDQAQGDPAQGDQAHGEQTNRDGRLRRTDVTGDGILSPLDALVVINALSEQANYSEQAEESKLASAVDAVFAETDLDDEEEWLDAGLLF